MLAPGFQKLRWPDLGKEILRGKQISPTPMFLPPYPPLILPVNTEISYLGHLRGKLHSPKYVACRLWMEYKVSIGIFLAFFVQNLFYQNERKLFSIQMQPFPWKSLWSTGRWLSSKLKEERWQKLKSLMKKTNLRPWTAILVGLYLGGNSSTMRHWDDWQHSPGWGRSGSIYMEQISHEISICVIVTMLSITVPAQVSFQYRGMAGQWI